MVRVKRGKTALKTRKNLLKRVKGYKWDRSKKERSARTAFLKAGQTAFAHRRRKKGDFRRVWNIKLSAEIKKHGFSYSKFIHAMKIKGVILNRKMLAELAENNKESFNRIVEKIK